ncbi:hypothetical protein [Pseudomonas soli]|uniref:hypothetical protein n=1 Tax=Pseudomonas soli TaxID=1306993 RepID=UPI00381E8F5C
MLDDEFNGSGIADLPMYDNSTDRYVIDLGLQDQKLLAAAVTEKTQADLSRTHYYAITRFDDDGSIDTTFGKTGKNGVVFGRFGDSSDSGCVSIATDGTARSSIWMLGWSSKPKGSRKKLLIAKFNWDANEDPDERYLPQPPNSSLRVEPPVWRKKPETTPRLQDSEKTPQLQNGQSNLLIHEKHLIATANFEDLETPPYLYRKSFEGAPGFGKSDFIEITHPDGKVTLTGLTISKGALLICGYITTEATIPNTEATESGFIARYRTDGTRDTTFGKNGTLAFQIKDGYKREDVCNTRAQQLCVRSSGEILVVGSRRNGLTVVPDGWAWQLTEEGKADDKFNAGKPQITKRDDGGVEWRAGLIEQDGGAIVFGTGLYRDLHLQRYDSTGKADPLATPPNEIRYATQKMISFEENSKILLAANTSGIDGYTGRVIRLLKNSTNQLIQSESIHNP